MDTATIRAIIGMTRKAENLETSAMPVEMPLPVKSVQVGKFTYSQKR